ncbi:hypothetical protein R3P38DRAFT_2770793 [Favolaschia claudopus]|uniref:Tyrosine specific protein phosphatases domain-containing protein n=1 Tax=Favolaschia claudopus TaxID=2862362 RepID=A0AAW0CKM0_9AGAR
MLDPPPLLQPLLLPHSTNLQPPSVILLRTPRSRRSRPPSSSPYARPSQASLSAASFPTKTAAVALSACPGPARLRPLSLNIPPCVLSSSVSSSPVTEAGAEALGETEVLCRSPVIRKPARTRAYPTLPGPLKLRLSAVTPGVGCKLASPMSGVEAGAGVGSGAEVEMESSTDNNSPWTSTSTVSTSATPSTGEGGSSFSSSASSASTSSNFSPYTPPSSYSISPSGSYNSIPGPSKPHPHSPYPLHSPYPHPILTSFASAFPVSSPDAQEGDNDAAMLETPVSAATYHSAPTSPVSLPFASPLTGNYTFSPLRAGFASPVVGSSSSGDNAATAASPVTLTQDDPTAETETTNAYAAPWPPPLRTPSLAKFASTSTLRRASRATTPTPGSPLSCSPSPSPIAFSFRSTSSERPTHPSPLLASSPPSHSHITPHIIIADLAFAESANLLEREGVTHVVSVLRERAQIPALIPASNRLHVPLDDAPFAELVGLLGPVVRWVEDVLASSKGSDVPEPRILIHCAHGISRSPAVGAALLVALPLVDGDVAVDLAVEGDVDMDNGESETESEVETGDVKTRPNTPLASPILQCESPAQTQPTPVSATFPPMPGAWAPSASALSHSASSPPTPPTDEDAQAAMDRVIRRTLSAPAALAYVSARRPAADVNWGFRAQLSEWEGVCRARDPLP